MYVKTVYMSMLSHYSYFVVRAKRLADKHLNQGYSVNDRLKMPLCKFYVRYEEYIHLQFDILLSRMLDDSLA